MPGVLQPDPRAAGPPGCPRSAAPSWPAARLERRAPRHEPAEPGEIHGVRDLDPVAHRPRRREHRVLEHEPAPQVHGQLHRPPAERVRRGRGRRVGRPGRPRRRSAPRTLRRPDRRPDRADRRASASAPMPGTTFRRAFTGPPPRRARPRRTRVPRGTRAAGRRPSPAPRTRGTSPPRTRRPAPATTWRNALRRASGEPDAIGSPAAALPPQRRDAHPPPTPERERRQRPEQRRPDRPRTTGRPTPRTPGRGPATDPRCPSDPSAVATTYSTSSGSRLDG